MEGIALLIAVVLFVIAVAIMDRERKFSSSSVPAYNPYTQRKLVGMKRWKNSYDEIIVYKVDGEKRTYYLLYRGNCTVWCSYPGGLRCGTNTEIRLANDWEYGNNHRELGDSRFTGRWTNEEMSEFLGREIK